MAFTQYFDGQGYARDELTVTFDSVEQRKELLPDLQRWLGIPKSIVLNNVYWSVNHGEGEESSEKDFVDVHVFDSVYADDEMNTLYCQDCRVNWVAKKEIEKLDTMYRYAFEHWTWDKLYQEYKEATDDENAVINPGVWYAEDDDCPDYNATPEVAALEMLYSAYCEKYKPSELKNNHYIVRFE